MRAITLRAAAFAARAGRPCHARAAHAHAVSAVFTNKRRSRRGTLPRAVSRVARAGALSPPPASSPPRGLLHSPARPRERAPTLVAKRPLRFKFHLVCWLLMLRGPGKRPRRDSFSLSLSRPLLRALLSLRVSPPRLNIYQRQPICLFLPLLDLPPPCLSFSLAADYVAMARLFAWFLRLATGFSRDTLGRPSPPGLFHVQRGLKTSRFYRGPPALWKSAAAAACASGIFRMMAFLCCYAVIV